MYKYSYLLIQTQNEINTRDNKMKIKKKKLTCILKYKKDNTKMSTRIHGRP